MANRDTGLWSKLQERLQSEGEDRPRKSRVTEKVRKTAGELKRKNETAARTTKAKTPARRREDTAPSPKAEADQREKARKGAKSMRKKTAPKLSRRATRAKSLSRRRTPTAAYKRELKARTDDTVMADIEARIEAGSRIRDEITAKIERVLAEDNADAAPEIRRGWSR